MTDKSKKSFVLYTDFESVLLRLSLKERGMLITLVFAYADRGEVEDIETLPPAVDIAFSIIRAQLDRDKEKYIQRCLKNSENAKKGVEYRKQLSAITNLLLPNTAK